jgi:hypothetical protein
VKHYIYDADGTLVAEHDIPETPHPLDAIGVAATLNAVLGVWSLSDAANAVNLTPNDLIHEAEAWAAAAGGGL